MIGSTCLGLLFPRSARWIELSILGDAIDYLKELLERINDLHNELEATPPGSLITPSSSFHLLTPTPPTLPHRVKEELCSSALPGPKYPPARVSLIKLLLNRELGIYFYFFLGRGVEAWKGEKKLEFKQVFPYWTIWFCLEFIVEESYLLLLSPMLVWHDILTK